MPHFALKTFAYLGLSTLYLKKMVGIALAIQYKCQVLRNTFRTLNMAEKREVSKFSVIYIKFCGTFYI